MVAKRMMEYFKNLSSRLSTNGKLSPTVKIEVDSKRLKALGMISYGAGSFSFGFYLGYNVGESQARIEPKAKSGEEE